MDYESLFYVLVSVSLLMTLAAWDYYRRWRRMRDNRQRVVEAYDNYSSSLQEQRAQIERASLKHWKRANQLEADNEILLEKLAEAEQEAGVQGHLADRAGVTDETLRVRIDELEDERVALYDQVRELTAKLADTQAQVSAADAARGYGKSMDAAPVPFEVGPTDVRPLPQIYCAGCGKVIPAPQDAVRGWCERCSVFRKVAL